MRVPGVRKVEADWKKGEAVVVVEKGKTPISQLEEAITKAGYRVSTNLPSLR